MNNRFINIRLPVVCACILAIGVATGYLFEFYRINRLYYIAVILFSALLFCVPIILKRNLKSVIFTFISFLFLITGIFICSLRLQAFSTGNFVESNNYLIEGTVYQPVSYGNAVILKNLKINGKYVSGKISVNLTNETVNNYDIGNLIVIETDEIIKEDAFEYGKLNYNVESNIKYSCYANDVIKNEYRFSLFGSIKNRLYKTLYNNLDYDTAAICYAMLVGDTSHMNENILNSFRYGGVAHIFAVSGLHIGIVFAVFSFLCKQLRFNKYFSSGISIALAFFYAGICGFTLSSVRAVIMCAVAVVAKLIYKKNDSFNALSIAVIFILLFSPVSLFSVGFQLSVCSVGGIFALSKNIERGLTKIKIPQKIASAASISFGAQLGTLPVMLTTFGYVSGAGLLLNLIVIPIISVMFAIVFVCGFLCSALSVAAPYILPYSVIPLQATLSFFVNSGFEKALISGFGAGLFTPLYFIAILSISDKLNLRLISRLLISICSAIVLGVYVLIQTFSPVNGFLIAVNGYYGGGTVLFKSSKGNVLIVSEYVNSSKINNLINAHYASSLDGLIVLGDETCVMSIGKLDVNCADAYICLLYIDIQPYDNFTVHYERSFNLCGIYFEFIDGKSVTAQCDGINIAVSTNPEIPFESCDLLVSQYPNSCCIAKSEVFFSLSGHKLNNYDYGEIVYFASEGSLKIKNTLPHILKT